MLCIYFKIRSEYPLKKYINKLDHIFDNRDNDNNKRYFALREMIIIYRAIDYAASFSINEFSRLIGYDNRFLGTKNFKFIDPITNTTINTNGIKLIKSVGRNGEVEKLPIFELRINRIDKWDLGFRCIFFIANYRMRKYQCYTIPFNKEEYTTSQNHLIGNMKTDVAIENTYDVFKNYQNNPVDFESLFVPSNIINR